MMRRSIVDIGRGDAGRIVLQADQDEVVIHQVVPPAAMAGGDEGILGGTRMIVSRSPSQRLAFSSAWPVPTATTRTDPGLAVGRDDMPVETTFCVEVVDCTMIDPPEAASEAGRVAPAAQASAA